MTTISLRSWNSSGECSLGNPEVIAYVQDKLFQVTYLKNGIKTIDEFTVARANSMALLCRTKRGGMSLIDVDDLLGLEEIVPPVVVPRLVVRTLAEITKEQVRQHLFERHGVMSTEIPEDPDKAWALHNLLHATPHLGHRHGNRGARPEVTADEVAQRAANLDAMYENTHECDSCGHIQNTDGTPFQPEMEGNRMFHPFMRDGEEFAHCEKCADPGEFSYTCNCFKEKS